MKPTLPIDDPFAVALGFSSTEAQFTYAAADTVLVLKWDTSRQHSCYEFLIIDTGFYDKFRDDMNEETKPHVQGTMTIAQASALMLLCVAADELNNGDDSRMSQAVIWMYQVVEKWLADAGIPSNLRPVP